MQKNLWEILKNYHTIGIFWSNISEPNTQVIIKRLLANKKRVFLPRILNETIMEFVEIKSLNFEHNIIKGCVSPNIKYPAIAKNILEVIVCPLVKYDGNNHRQGHGYGYYDRYLEDYQGKKIGFAFDDQYQENIPIKSWDVKMDLIITIRRNYVS